MNVRRPTTKNKSTLPAKQRDLPATCGMVWDLRNELKSDIRSVDAKVDGLSARMDARFSEMEARFRQVDARFVEMDARFDTLETRLEAKIDSSIHRMEMLAEEQRSENRIMFEYLKGLGTRFEELSARQDTQDRVLRQLALGVGK